MNPCFMESHFIELPKTRPYSIKHNIKKKNEEEQEICIKIKKIPYFYCYFSPIASFTDVNTDDLQKYSLVEQEELLPFDAFFSHFYENQFHIVLIDTFCDLEEAVVILNKNGLSQINGWNIGINRQNQPLLYDFERNDENLANVPIERQIADFLEKSPNLDSLSMENIEHVCSTFLRSCLTTSRENETKREIMDFCGDWINLPRENILEHICKHDYRWNHYKLAVLYLDVISKYKQTKSHYLDGFIKKMQSMCPILPISSV
jgi:hypothetical protein